MGWLERLFLISFTVNLVACGSPVGNIQTLTYPDGSEELGEQGGDPDVIEIDPAQPIEDDEVGMARWEAAGKSTREWTLYAYKEIEKSGSNLIETTPDDIVDFCPSYPNLSKAKKKNFWIYLLSSIAAFESNFNPALSYTEDFVDSTGKKVVSRGLLQLSGESSRGYGCPIKKDTDLHDPKINIACGLRILNKWVKTDKVIRGNSNGWKGGARYWSVLRRDNQFDAIRSWTRLLNFCH